MNKLFRFLTGRMFIFGLCILLQVVFWIFVVIFLGKYDMFIYIFFTLLTLATILYIVSKKDNPIYKLAWVIPIALFPMLGWFFYYAVGRNKLSKKKREQMNYVLNITKDLTIQNEEILEEIKNNSLTAYNQINYIRNTALLPIQKDTQTFYLSPGEIFFEKLCEELNKAEHFIFMEYFILQEGKMWDTILEILSKKATEGVEVKLMYDDLGCIGTLPSKYHKKIAMTGIEVKVFNVFKPSIDNFMNYRDHRKITVIDGNIGFMGGNNLADEYINEIEKHGHWKDSSLMLKGDAVWNLSVLFLQMWQFDTKERLDYDSYRPTQHYDASGYVLPFGDGPLDNHLIGETAYINMIMKAKKYVSITTPYLILDNEMISALCSAAYSGVKVSIVTPGIADKWYVHMVTRYNYKTLVEAGVEIYEYTGGFIHAKTAVCDDTLAIVGTQNFDFRSFYLHYECGTLLYKTTSVKEVREDHINTIARSKRITLEDCKHKNPFYRFMQICLNLFAPLM